ncbi:MAG: hypothetical protein BWX66_01961 [Deltaproteobacteria bacterium ADurb.Bin058]|nr:MAG: hypothetical protein BWX66_01961 [Deltaproteobacteria bacterium ADurb.Bin058]
MWLKHKDFLYKVFCKFAVASVQPIKGHRVVRSGVIWVVGDNLVKQRLSLLFVLNGLVSITSISLALGQSQVNLAHIAFSVEITWVRISRVLINLNSL